MEPNLHGLVAPGYKMTTVAVTHVVGNESTFEGVRDMSAKLKLLGVKVGSIGDANGRTPVVRATFTKMKRVQFTNA